MKLSLNPFTLIIRNKESYYFIFSNLADSLEIKPTVQQQECLESLRCGNKIERTVLESIFSDEIVRTLITRRALSEEEKDVTSIFSRTDAFFESFNMPDARSRLNASNVLILGCGGIGTHLAWHMVAVGVGKLTLVDFDSVEESNLNRQILFDRNDIGKSKAEVLKLKLQSINPATKIRTISIRISSEEDLEKVCVSDNYSVVVKALDSPSSISMWLDHICKRHHLPYIAGITARETVLVGPSFIPGISEIGWSDLLPNESDTERVTGIAPSIGIMLYYASSELAIEAVKLLTGYGVLSYLGRVRIKNVFTNQEQIIAANVETDSRVNDGSELSWIRTKGSLLGLLLVASVSTLSLINPWLILVAGIVAMATPNYLFNKQKEIMLYTFSTSAIFSVISSVVVIRNNIFIQHILTSPYAIIAATILLGFLSLSILLICGINSIIFQKFIASKGE